MIPGIEEIFCEVRKECTALNEDVKTTYDNVWGTARAVLSGQPAALHAHWKSYWTHWTSPGKHMSLD